MNGATAVLTFDEELDTNVVQFTLFRFRVGTTGVGASATAIAISGRTVTLTLASAVTHGQTVQMQYARNTVQPELNLRDLAGNDWGTLLFGTVSVTNNTPAVDTTRPSVVSATVNGSTAVLTFNEELDTNPVPARSFRFRAHATTPSGAGASATAIAISGRTVTLTLASAVTQGQIVQMQFVPQTERLRDLAGNGWRQKVYGAVSITNDTPAPGTTPQPVLATVNGTTLTITMPNFLDTGSVPAASAFTVRADGDPVALVSGTGTTPVAVSGKTVTLTLVAAVAAHEKVTVGYHRPATGRLRNTGGTETQSFANVAAANVTPTPATRIVSVAIVSKPSHDTNSDNTPDTYGLVGHDPDENGVFRQMRGEHVLVRVTWSADVVWDVPAGGDLSVPLDVGGSEKAASLRKGRATRGRARSLVFGYKVQAADTDTDAEGFELTPTAAGDLVVLSGGATLLDAQGRAVSRSHPGLSGGETHKVNGGLTPVADATPPKLVHATVNGATVTLTFDDDVKTSAATPTANDRAELAFAFTIQGGRHEGAVIVNQGPHRVAVRDSTVTLTLLAPVAAHQPATVYYRLHKTSSGTDTAHQLRDAAGNKVAKFSQVLTNVTPPADPPVMLRGQVEGRTLTMVFDRGLDAGSRPEGRRFRVYDSAKVFGNFVRGTGTAKIRGATVTVTLAEDPGSAAGAWAFYEKGDEANPLRGAAGIEVEDIRLYRMRQINDTTPPTSGSGSVSGTDVTLYFDEALDESAIPAASAFSVIVGTASGAAPAEVVVRGNAVFLALASATGASDAVTVAYTAPTAPATGLRDLAGNRAASLSHATEGGAAATLTNEGTTRPAAAPALAATGPATMNGNVLTLSFDQALDPTKVPDKSAFALDQSYLGVNLVTVRGKTVELQMVRTAMPCDTFNLTYARPSVNALQNRWGMEAGEFTGQAVANAQVGNCTAMGGSGLSGSGERMMMEFHQALEPQALPRTAYFTVTPAAPAAAPVPVLDAAFAANGAGVELTLGRTVADGEGLTVHYRRPQGELGLWTAQRRQLADFDAEAVAGARAAVTGVAMASDPGDDETYAAGEKVRVQLAFSEAVDVGTESGAPRLKLDLGGDDGAGERWAAYEDGSGSDALTFAWTAAAPDEAPDGIAVLADTLELDGGTIRSKATQEDALLGHAGLAADPAHKVDAAPPKVLRGEIDGGTVTLHFSEALDPDATGGSFMVSVATSETGARGFNPTGEVAVDGATVTVGLGERAPHAPHATAGLTERNWLIYWRRADGSGGALSDLAGNPVAAPDAGRSRDGHELRSIKIGLENVTRAGTGVTGIEVISDAGSDDTYALGERIRVQVTFSEAVEVDTTGGTPGLIIDMDPADWGEKRAAYESGSGTETLVFAHEVAEPNISTQGIAVPASTLALHGGTIRWAASQEDATLGHAGLAHDPDHKVDWRTQPASGGDDSPGGTGGDGGPPSVTGVSVVSSPASGDTYMLGETIRVQVTFDAAVSVTGTPRLSIDMDPAHWGTKHAAYAGGGGTTSLTFSHAVVEPNHSTQGIAVLANSLALDGGTIRSAASQEDAALAHSGLGHDSDHKVDWRPAVSVADARASEGAGASISFEVSLDRAFTTAAHRVTVDYATADGTAVAGEDYTATYGILIFAAGETTKTVSVPILDDSHDEGEETFALRLSNAAGARIGDGEATGTIVNDDPVPDAWLARFGRSVAESHLDAVRDRLAADRSPGFTGRFAGQPLPGPETGTGLQNEAVAENALTGPESPPDAEMLVLHAPSVPEPEAGRARPPEEFPEDGILAFRSFLADGDDGEDGPETQAVAADDALLGTSFIMMRDTETGLSHGFWGRASRSGFSGRDGETSLDGEVTGVMLGTDWRRKGTLFGMILSRNRGAGTYSGASSGEIDVTLTALVPWAGREIGDGLSVWGAAGIGRGDMTLTPDGGEPMETGVGWSMASAGAEGALASGPGGMDLDWHADALRTQMSSDAATGLAAGSGATTRLRLGVTANWQRTLETGATLRPRLEAGLRHDGGDAETGFGLEIGGGFGFSDPASGLSVTVDGRTLALHEDGAFRNWGLSLGLSWDPRPETKRGWSLSGRQSLGGASSGGVEALLGQDAKSCDT